MRREDLIKSIHGGVRAACKEYGEWSDGESIHDRGIESLLVSSIARKIAKGWKAHKKTAYLSLETPFGEVAENSYSIPRRGALPKVLRGNRRADIVLWTSTMSVSGVIEVKRKWSPGPCHYDLERLRALVKHHGHQHHGTVQMGFLVALVVVKKGKLDAKIDEIREGVKAIETDAVSLRVHSDHLAAYVDDEIGKSGYSVIVEVVPKRGASEIVDTDSTPDEADS